jgi:acetyl-CoA carboxylase biotin carboxyl carrier protein
VDLTNDDVADILALIDSLPYDSLDLRTDRFRLTLRRTPDGGWTEESEVLTQPTEVTPEPGGPTGEGGTGPGGGPAAAAGADGLDADGLDAVVAPLPGTFYRSPRPGAPPFVSEGDAVGADTVVAIIETMKLMNSVLAGTPGVVTRILPDNGDLVPLGAPLLLIDPDPAPSTAPDS